jgi:two-component system, NtrC family, sensor kinase
VSSTPERGRQTSRMGRRAKPAKKQAARKVPAKGAARDRALAEAREQQRATSEILRVIASSPADLQPVLDTMVRNAARLCDALDVAIFRMEGDELRLVAHDGIIAPVAPVGTRVPAGRGSVNGRAVHERRTIHVPDLQLETEDFPEGSANALRLGWRATLIVPLMREGTAIGTIALRRREARPFSDSQIELLETFADQAVIAIENARLLSELQDKNGALTRAHTDVVQALERQTATADVLRVISSSPTDVQPVLDAVVESAMRLCHAYDARIWRLDGDRLVRAAGTGPLLAQSSDSLPLDPALPSPAAFLGRRTVHFDETRVQEDARFVEVQRRLGIRSGLATPLMREGNALGVLAVRSQQPGRFSDQQVELLRSFADQAVIAIENVRLFTELQTSNHDLTKALDTQTATSDILRVISGSRTDVQPVFDAIVQSAVRLLRGYSGSLTRIEGDQLVLAASTSTDAAGDAVMRGVFPMSLESDGSHPRTIRDRAPLNVADALADPRVPELGRRIARARGYQSQAVVPMLRQGDAIGTIAVTRHEPGGFTDDEIALLQTFADQAVIAIENARLLTELQARTEELTRSVGELRALGEIGQAIGSTLELQTVLATIVARATELAGAAAGVIYEYDAQREIFEPRATERLEQEIVRALVATPVRKGQGVTGRLAVVAAPLQRTDIRETGEQPPVALALIRAGYRALLAVPLVREDHLIGGLTVFRRTPGEFPANVVELMQTFATQSALAIQNARLFREIEIKSRELEVASQHKSEFLASMSHELRTPLNAVIGFSDVLLQGMFGETNEKQTEYLRDILASGQHLLSLINDILDLSKIEAGRMDLDVAAFDLPTAIDDALLLMRERAGRRGVALERQVDMRLGEIQADQRKVKQVLLNLLSNAVKFTPEGGRIDVRAAVADGMLEISVTDTGIGIAPEDHDAVFEEFRQVGKADKKAEGTGLGLALCRKFVELHGGRIWVKSQLGAGSTFTFTLPLDRPRT